MKERIKWIDTAKGIAIILVVIGHVVQSYHNVHLYENSLLFNFTHKLAYSFHMPLFMIISGMLLHSSLFGNIHKLTIGGKTLILNKLLSYGIPYVVFSIIWWTFKMIFAGNVNSTVNVKDILLIFIYPISFMWFIYALLIMVLIQIWIGRKATNHVFIGFHLFVSVICLIVRPYLVENLSYISFNDCIISDIMRNYFYFLTGFYANKIILNLVSKNRVSIVCLTGGVLILSNVFSMEHKLLLQIIIALCGSLFTFFISKHIENSTILNYIGKCSLTIYVLQGLSIAATRQALAIVYRPQNDEIGWIPWIICTLMGVLIPILIYLLSTKIWKFDFVFTPTKYLKFK